MTFKSFIQSAVFILTIVLLSSCDNGFNEIGASIVNQYDSFEFGTPQEYSVVAYNQNIGPVQTNNLSVNSLGIYYNPAFGTTTSNFATQLELASINPTIDLDLVPEIQSVVLTVPYFNTKTGLKDDGVSGIYRLDSIYGLSDSKLKLSVYESKYFMRELDPATQLGQVYYSNQSTDFDGSLGVLLNDDAGTIQNTAFSFSNEEYSETVTSAEGVATTTRTAPGMRLNLNKDFFKTKFFTAAQSGQLINNNTFKNYIRGLYFKVENSGIATTNLAMMNFRAGKITILYKQYLTKPVTGSPLPEKTDKSIVLNLSGNCVNLFKNEYLPTYTAAIAAADAVNGDSNLFLKGGEGSMAVISLFTPTELATLRAQKLLINDASLTFTINNDLMGNALTYEPNRIYLYDLNNKKPVADYNFDITTLSNQKNNKYIFGGIINKTSGGRGTTYKIKLTNQIRNLIKNDTVTNVKFGLLVTENINISSNAAIKNPVFSPVINHVPVASIMNPLGTILYGSNETTVPEAKRPKFKIYYTKPKN